MNEAIGNASLTKIVVFMTSCIILILVCALSYSKAYKAKNIIIQNLEKYGSYEVAKESIDASLHTLGYQLDSTNECKDYQNVESNSDYKYCVYKMYLDKNDKADKKNNSGRGYYYKVVTYMQFKFPIVEGLQSKVRGETKVLGKTYNY